MFPLRIIICRLLSTKVGFNWGEQINGIIEGRDLDRLLRRIIRNRKDLCNLIVVCDI